MNTAITTSSSTSSRSTLRRIVAGTVLSGLTIAGVTAGAISAGADPATSVSGPKLDAARTKCLSAIDRRISRLDELTSKVGDDEHLTDAHRSTLSGIVSHALDGMNTLRPQVQGATDAASLRTSCTAVVDDYRVFALVAPQVHLTRVADAAAFGINKLAGVDTKIDDAISAAAAAGKDVTKATADADAFSAAVAKVGTDVSGLADSVLALTPADYNANHNVLDAARAQAKTARTDAQAARTAGQAVRADLKALRG